MQPSQHNAPLPPLRGQQGAPQPVAQPGQPQVIVIPAKDGSIAENYSGGTSRVLGIIQIIGGVLAFIIQIVLIAIESGGAYFGYGFAGGILVSRSNKKFKIQ